MHWLTMRVLSSAIWRFSAGSNVSCCLILQARGNICVSGARGARQGRRRYRWRCWSASMRAVGLDCACRYWPPTFPPPSSPGRNPEEEMSVRSEEHTSELQSLMRISYAVFCLKKKKHKYIQRYKE